MSLDDKAIKQALSDALGPILFRLVWWNHLAPNKRVDFSDDLLDVIATSFIPVAEQEFGRNSPMSSHVLVKLLVKTVAQQLWGDMLSRISFGDTSYEKLIGRIVSSRDDSDLHRLLSDQYDKFTSRIANLSPQLIDAVKLIDEEFIIWLKTHPEDTLSIHPDAFEQLTGEILTSHGFEIRFTGRVKNQSADLIAVQLDRGGHCEKYLIECKRYALNRPVGMSILNAVIGASYRAEISYAMLVTTSSFSSDVKETARSEIRNIRLELRDGDQVNEWLAGYEFKEHGLWLPSGWQDDWEH